MIVDDLRGLNREQRAAFTASLLGWTLDAFDFFTLIFVASDIARAFSTTGHEVKVSTVNLAVALTLMARPAGAFAFGWLADRYGRRPVLMGNILLFAVLAFASGFAPNLGTLFAIRMAFGFAMGGEWGVGASLALESIPAKSRGVVSGLLQAGYPLGYLIASLAYLAIGPLGWRGMLMLGAVPALLVAFIAKEVKESPAFEAERAAAAVSRAAPRAAPEPLPSADQPRALFAQVATLLAALGPLLYAALAGRAGTWGVGTSIWLLLPLLAPMLLYSRRRGGSFAVQTHVDYALATFWLAITGAVVAGLITFSVTKPVRALGGTPEQVAAAFALVLTGWLVARSLFGLQRALGGKALRPLSAESFFGSLASAWPRLLYVVVLMTAFNFFSHGTQDNYPNFLKLQHHFTPALVSTLTVIGNIGAIVGGLTFGALSERIGRRKAIAAAAILALPVIPLWAFSSTPVLLGLGAFCIQVAVQGAWGVVPVHLNELSPDRARGTFPGFAYQLGNLIASGNAVIQSGLAESRHAATGRDDYGFALALVAGLVAVTLAGLAWFGPEAKGVAFGKAAATEPTPAD